MSYTVKKLLLCLGLFMAALTLTGCKDEVVKVGEPAPGLTVLTLSGDTFQEKPWTAGGQYTYLNFWSSSCAPCMVELSHLEALSQEYHDRVRILSINIDQKKAPLFASLSKFASAYPVLHDPLGITAERYLVQGTPASYIIDDHGDVKKIHTGMRSFDELHELFEVMAKKEMV